MRFLIYLPLLGSTAVAFMPTKFFAAQGWLGYSHEQMCHDSMTEIAKDLYLKYKSTKTMEQARIEVAKGNSDTDHDFHTSEKHFDGESIPEAQQRLQRLRKQVVALLREAHDAQGAREALGTALHTLQDFYSHSNWIELGNTEPHPLLGRDQPMTRLGPEVATCQPCVQEHRILRFKCPNCTKNLLFTQQSSIDAAQQKLTTGYYSDESRIKPNDKKCSHGGLFDKSTSFVGGGLNKDTISCHMSPHSHLHWAAIHMATQGTTQYIMDIIAELTAAETAALLGVGSENAIAFEKSRRAGDAIRLAKERLKAVIKPGVRSRPIAKRNESSAALENDVIFINTPLNGVKHPSEISWNNYDVSPTSGNSSCEKSGLFHALSRIPSGGRMFVYVDNDRQQDEHVSHYHAVAHLASTRGIRIYPINSDDNISEAERLLSQLTGGEVVDEKHASDLLSLKMPADAELGTIFRTTTPGTYKIPVDSSVSTLLVNGASKVTDPTGKVMTSCQKIFTQPAPGVWEITSTQKELSVKGVSNLQINGGLHMTQVAGRPGHTGYFAVQNVLSGSSYTAVSNVACGTKDAKFQLHHHAPALTKRNQQGCVPPRRHIDLPMVRADNLTDLHANVTVPAGRYSLVVTGTDAQGHAVRRQLAAPLRSADYSVNIHGMILVDSANVATAKIHVTRSRHSQTVEKVTLTPSLTNNEYQIIEGASTSELTIGPGESKEVVVKVKLGCVSKGSATLLAVLNTAAGEHIVASRMLPLQEH